MELPRAEGARAEPHSLQNFGKPIKPRKFGLTSPYERASERTPSVQTLGKGARRLNINLTGELNDAIFSLRDLHLRNEKLIFQSICYVSKR